MSSQGARGTSGNNLKDETNPEDCLLWVKFQLLWKSFMKTSSPDAHAKPLEVQATPLDLGFNSTGHITNCFKNVPKLCVCLCKPGPYFCAQRLYGSQPTGGIIQGSPGSAAVKNTPKLRTAKSAFSYSPCPLWLAGVSASGRYSGTWAEGAATNSTQLLLSHVTKRKRALQGNEVLTPGRVSHHCLSPNADTTSLRQVPHLSPSSST